jgi:hypothetical protein
MLVGLYAAYESVSQIKLIIHTGSQSQPYKIKHLENKKTSGS